MGGTAGYGALPRAGRDLDLDLSDLRRAMVGLGSRAGLSGGRIPWARCALAMHSAQKAPGGTEGAEHGGARTAALPPPPAPTAITPPGAGTRTSENGSTAVPAEPHPADPRPPRPSSRALRNPAQRRPVDVETAEPAVLGRPGAGQGPGTGHSGQGPDAPGPGGPPGRVPPSRSGRRDQPSSGDQPTSDETPRADPTAAPGGGDGGDEVWQLVRQAQEGDAQAFALIYDRYFDTVYRYISYRTGSRTVAEDLTSEVWLRALRRIGSVSWQGRDLGA